MTAATNVRTGATSSMVGIRLDSLSLQALEVETPSDLQASGNSIYTCVARSGLSVCCGQERNYR